MAVNLTNADSALKSYYLDAICEQLNKKANPLLAAIGQSTDNVYGKEVRKFTTYGMNGGIGAGTEDGALPAAKGNLYSQMVVGLKNLYGTIEISDKAIRASENNSGAFVSLLNAEMEGLVKASSFNFGRMLFGDGTGMVAVVTDDITSDKQIPLNDVSALVEGMVIEFVDPMCEVLSHLGVRTVLSVDRKEKTIKISGSFNNGEIPPETGICIQGSVNNEITGLKAIFDTNSYKLYGLDRSKNTWLNPYVNDSVGEISELTI